MRTSMITGLYPHQTGVQSNSKGKFRGDDKFFLGKIFKQAGYKTAYFGKWHMPLNTKKTDIHGFDTFMEKARLDPKPAAAFLKQKHSKPFLAVASFLSPHEICEWARKEELPGGSIGDLPPISERPPTRGNSESPENRATVKRRQEEVFTHYRGKFGMWGGGLANGPAFEAADVADNLYDDGYAADCAVATLRALKDKPFFLGVGFKKPHLPFVAPKKYWDLYNPANIELANNPFAPKNAPAMGLHASFELRTRTGVPKRATCPTRTPVT